MMNKLLNTFGFLFVMTSLSGQCLDEQIHNNSSNSIWMSCQSSINPLTEYGDSHWILYQFEEEQSIENMKIWNLNHHDNIVSGIKSMNVDISPDGAVWTNIGVLNLDMADGTRSYIGTEYAQLGPFRAQFVLFTAIDNYGGLVLDCPKSNLILEKTPHQPEMHIYLH